MWTLACAFLGALVIHSWRSTLALRRSTLKRVGGFGSVAFITLLPIPFLIGEVVGLGALVRRLEYLVARRFRQQLGRRLGQRHRLQRRGPGSSSGGTSGGPGGGGGGGW